MSENLTLLVGMLTAISLITGLVGLAVRFVLLPWLREHIAEPVKETQRQVTVNKHVSSPPTLLDKIDHLARDVRTAATMFEGHIGYSSEDRRQLWEAIEQLRKDRNP